MPPDNTNMAITNIISNYRAGADPMEMGKWFRIVFNKFGINIFQEGQGDLDLLVYLGENFNPQGLEDFQDAMAIYKIVGFNNLLKALQE